MTECDGPLLWRFAGAGDEAAFEALLSRHGPMVWNVCRRVLGHEQDAEDACQATFMVLARKAGSLRKRDSVSSWLHGVALRVSLNARKRLRARRESEEAMERVEPEDREEAWKDLAPVLVRALKDDPEFQRQVDKVANG